MLFAGFAMAGILAGRVAHEGQYTGRFLDYMGREELRRAEEIADRFFNEENAAGYCSGPYIVSPGSALRSRTRGTFSGTGPSAP